MIGFLRAIGNKLVSKLLFLWFTYYLIDIIINPIPDQPILTFVYLLICIMCDVLLGVYICDDEQWAKDIMKSKWYWINAGILFAYYLLFALPYDWFHWNSLPYVAIDIAFLCTDSYIAENYFNWFKNPSEINIGKCFSLFFKAFR